MNNKRVKIESRDIIEKNFNENNNIDNNSSKKLNPISQINSGDLKLPNINKSVALRKLKETMDKNMEKYNNEKNGILKNNENKLNSNSQLQSQHRPKKSNSQAQFNNYDSNNDSSNNNDNNIQEKNHKKNNSKFSPRLKSVDFNENINKINETLNSDLDKEKENDENINEISNMMKDILSI